MGQLDKFHLLSIWHYNLFFWTTDSLDIFGTKLGQNGEMYTKEEALELADCEGSNESSKAKSGSLSSEGSSEKMDSKAERKMLILELLDNIYKSQTSLSKA